MLKHQLKLMFTDVRTYSIMCAFLFLGLVASFYEGTADIRIWGIWTILIVYWFVYLIVFIILRAFKPRYVTFNNLGR